MSQSTLKSRLKNIDLFLIDALIIQNSVDKEIILNKYKKSEFYDDIQSVVTARNAYQKVLVKYTLEKNNIRKQLITAPIEEIGVISVIEEITPSLVKKSKKKNK